MSHLIEKHQQNNKGRGVIRRRSLLSPEQEIIAQNRTNLQPLKSDAIAESTKTIRDNINNQRRTFATKQAIREDLKNNSMPSQRIKLRIIVPSTTNPEDIHVERVLGEGKNPLLEERKENPDRRVNNELLQQYYTNQDLKKRFIEEVLPATGEFVSTIIPGSKHLGYLYGKATGDDTRSFADLMFGTNKGLDNHVLNIAADVFTPGAAFKLLKSGSKALGYVPKFMRFYNSPLTHNWTLFGNKVYRMNPRANSGFIPEIESKVIDPRFSGFIKNNFGFPFTGDLQGMLNVINPQNIEPYIAYLKLLRDVYGIPIPNRFIGSNARNVAKEGRYTKFDIESNPLLARSFPTVYTGGHGNFISEYDTPNSVFTNLTSLRFNPYESKEELSKIRFDNPRGYSGIRIHTHNHDTSSDSSELAYAIARSLGDDFYPVKPSFHFPDPGEVYKEGSGLWDTRVIYNNLGYKNLFVPANLWQLDNKVVDLIKGTSYPKIYTSYKPNSKGQMVEYLDIANRMDPGKLFSQYGYKTRVGSDGSLILTDPSRREVGFIQALKEDEVLNKHFNEPIKKFNDKFGTEYEGAEIVPDSDIRYYPAEWNAPLWTFRKTISGPKINGFLLGKGGKIN